MTTTLAKPTDATQKKWYIIDAAGQELGRLAVVIANLLRGRDNPLYTPHIDAGSFVVVINASKVKVTGKKFEQKEYMFYSGYMGGERYETFKDLIAKKPDFIIKKAVNGMMPNNRLSREMMTKLKVFAGETHTHEAQKPIPYTL